MNMIGKIIHYPLMALALAGCVTINIYFPAAAAEDAARTIVRDVLKSDQSEKAPVPGADGKQSRREPLHPLAVGFGRLLDVLVPAAYAAQADITINTAAINALRASMQQRQASLAPFYRSGAIGFDAAGMVDMRDLAVVPLADRNRLKKLLADENSDRANLYKEIARANGHPEWEAEVQATFAKVWAEEALPGYWFHDGKLWRQR